MTEIRASVLGPLAISVGGVAIAISSAKQRAVVAMLVLGENRVVPIPSIVEGVWGDPPPDRAEHTLQQHVSAIRKLIEPDRAAATEPKLLTRSPGYLLAVDHLDAAEFARTAELGRSAATAGRWPDAVDAFETAIAQWQGHVSALSDCRLTTRLDAAAARLDEQLLLAIEGLGDARLACGQSRELVPDLEHLVAQHPLREGLRGQLMLALYRSGRQADALAAYRSARETLIDELGVEPGPALRDLEQAILIQSPRLDLGAASASTGSTAEDLQATYRAGDRSDLGRIEFPDGQVVHLPPGRSVIGRDPGVLIRLVDNRASRQHAAIDASEVGCVLRDLGSSNGTTVNGASVDGAHGDGHHLLDGDVISVGGVEIRYRGPG